MRRQLVRDTALYGGAALLRRSIGFLLLLVFTRVLSQAEYAALDLAVAATALLIYLLDLRLGPAVVRYYHDHLARRDAPRLLGGALAVRLLTSGAVAVLLIAAAGFLGWGYVPPGASGLRLWMVAVGNVPLALTVDLLFIFLRVQERGGTYTVLSVISAAICGLLSLVLIVGMRLGAVGFLAGQALGNALTVVLVLWSLRHEVRWTWSPPQFRRLVAYGGPLIPAILLGWAWTYLSRFFLAAHLPVTDIAVFALAMKAVQFMDLVGVAYRAAWEPLSMKVLYADPEGSAAKYARSFNLYAACLVLMTGFLSAAAYPLVRLMAPVQYSPAADLVPFLALASALSFLASTINIGNEVAAETAHWSLATLGATATMLLLLWAMLPRLGVLAAGVAMLAGAVVQVLIVFKSAQAHFHVPYTARSRLASSAAAAGFVGLVSLHLWAGVPEAFTAPAITLVALVCAWQVLDADDRIRLRQTRLKILGERRTTLV